jgi:hypothetical protein
MKPSAAAPMRFAYVPAFTLSDRRAIEIDAALREIERELARHIIRFSAVERAALTFVLERFAERWPKERGGLW